MTARRPFAPWPLATALVVTLAAAWPAQAQSPAPAAPAASSSDAPAAAPAAAASAPDIRSVTPSPEPPVVPIQAQNVPAPMQTPPPAAASGQEPTHEGLQVTEAYLELRTGPGRGYPIVFAISRGDWVVVEMRHTDWFRLRTESGRVGWAHRRDLESTLTASGVRKTFRDVLVDDYLRRRLDAGAAWGLFGKEPMLKLWTSYRLADPLTVEASVGQVQGTFSGTEFWHLNLLAEPWSDQRLSPYFSVGLGKFKNFPNQSLVQAITTDAKLGNAALGLRWYLSERFVLRTDYTIYTAFVADERSIEYRALSFGLSVFF